MGGVVATLLPEGVREAVEASTARKVYVPNPGPDPEARGMTVEQALQVLRRHAGDVEVMQAPRTLSDGRVDPVSLSEALVDLA